MHERPEPDALHDACHLDPLTIDAGPSPSSDCRRDWSDPNRDSVRRLGFVTVAAGPRFDLDDSFARELAGLHEPWEPVPVADPSLLVLNEALAAELGLDVDALRSPDGVAVLVGNAVPEGVTPVAQAYAGHQFGGYSPRLGDGRALLLGELVDADGARRDLHLKGSGRTPFARGGDGKAAVGPMLREYVISEAMHALGIPTTRALAVVATGRVDRPRVTADTLCPAPCSPGSRRATCASARFQYAAATGDVDAAAPLADHAIARHHPDAADAEHPYLALFEAVVDAPGRRSSRGGCSSASSTA